jgi:REP element-mobilizing transposase RayT
MPRKARIDAPGALHHIIFRGIEQRLIFRDDRDRDQLIDRLSEILAETDTPCYAWALMPNHVHFLLKTGLTPIATIMRRLLTGYAGYFNRRHRRHGHLFQNRYKSILCQEESYFRELVRYIHLNPLRAKGSKLITCWLFSAKQNQLLEEHIFILSKRVSHRVEGMSLQVADWCVALADGQPSELSGGVQCALKEMNEF